MTNSEEFKAFHGLLMANAPPDFVPWYFPLTPNEKDPDGIEIANRAPDKTPCCGSGWMRFENKVRCAVCKKTGKGSWVSPWARLTDDEATTRLKKGGNVGIAARADDGLVLIDIDNAQFVDMMPKTLTSRTRTRFGRHGFAFTNDFALKVNIPTSDGEVRASDQYVVAPGSFVPTTRAGLEKKVIEKCLKAEEVDKILADPRLGCYTVDSAIPAAFIRYNDLPEFFRTAAEKVTTAPKQEEKPAINQENVHPLYKITYKDIFPNGWDSKRMPHPLHDSETGQNFNVERPHLAQCWRHLVSLTPVQFLAVKAGYCPCEKAGNSHKNGGGGRSQVTGNNEAILAAFKQALKDGLLPADCKPPVDKKQAYEKFEMIPAAQLLKLDITNEKWVVSELVPKAGVTFLVGKSGGYKSFLALQMGRCVSMGERFLKFNTEKTAVLYLDNENGTFELARRAQVLKKPFGEMSFAFSQNVFFDRAKDYEPVEQFLDAHPGALVIADTFRRFIKGDENDSTAVAPALNNMKRMAENYGASFVFLHHVRKMPSNGKKADDSDPGDDIRGSSDIRGVADAIMTLEDKGLGVLRMDQIKRRSGRRLAPSRLEISETAENGFEIQYVGTMMEASSELQTAMEAVSNWAFTNNISEFRKKDVAAALPSISSRTLQRVIGQLVADGKFEMEGARGPYRVKKAVSVPVSETLENELKMD